MITRVESEILLFAYEKYLSEEPLITPGEVAEVRWQKSERYPAPQPRPT